jgi:GrpB-like predicted nucleotidyltransferase (UPF0157 family)
VVTGVELLGEAGGDRIELAEYDEAWQDVFAQWRDRLAATLGGIAVRIDHVGSTAIPGLAAKPIVDVQVSVLDVGDEASYVSPNRVNRCVTASS